MLPWYLEKIVLMVVWFGKRPSLMLFIIYRRELPWKWSLIMYRAKRWDKGWLMQKQSQFLEPGGVAAQSEGSHSPIGLIPIEESKVTFSGTCLLNTPCHSNWTTWSKKGLITSSFPPMSYSSGSGWTMEGINDLPSRGLSAQNDASQAKAKHCALEMTSNE